jgi:exopolysaccharide biosynthesis WecB/TagA/CpsF family protein
VTILGVKVATLTASEALGELVRLLDSSGPPASVAFVNAHTLNLASAQPDFRAVLNRAALILNDGAGLAFAARVQGARFPANLNGSDFLPHLLALSASRGDRVYLLGAKPGVAQLAAASLQRCMPTLIIAGFRDGYFPAELNHSVVEEVRATRPTLLLVAFGNPAQEHWLDEYLAATGARVGIGVGAFLDFVAGTARRAPRWMRTVRMEWAYRLSQEPRRLWRRYVVGNPAFLARIVLERLDCAGHRRAPDIRLP